MLLNSKIEGLEIDVLANILFSLLLGDMKIIFE